MQRRPWAALLALWLCNFLAATAASAQVTTAWPAGAPLRIEYRVVDVNAHDAAGNWSVDELVSYPAGNGETVQWSQVWSLKDGELSVTRGTPPSELPLSQPWFQEYRLKRLNP